MRRRIQTEEVEFLHLILSYLANEQGKCVFNNIACPHWDIEKNSCTAKSNDQLCRKINIPLVDDDHIIEIREKTLKDSIDELNQEIEDQKERVRSLQIQIKNQTNERAQIQQDLELLEQAKEKLLRDYEQDSDSE